MEYRDNRSIYLQIADHMCENILGGQWKENGRIPSIREMAMETEVNPNTVMRSYNYLQQKGIIFNKRGIGYFIGDGAGEKTRDMIRDEFLARELPYLFRRMDLLGITIDDLSMRYKAQQEEKS